MTRTIGFAVVAVTLASASAVHAKPYQSSFGLTVDIPDNWLALTKQVIQDDPALANPDKAALGNINPNMIKDLSAKVESGALEVFFDRATSDATFADNINLRQGTGKVPDGPDSLKAGCDAYSQALAKLAGRTLAMAACEDRTIGTVKAFYVEYEGVDAGTVTMQYQVPRPDGKMLYVTATCKRTSLDKVRPDFEAIVRSIKFVQPTSAQPPVTASSGGAVAQQAVLAEDKPRS